MNDPKTVVREMADGARPWTPPDREARRERDKAIGEGAVNSASIPETLTLESALEHFALIADGKRVADIRNPGTDLAYSDWAAKCAGSKVKRIEETADGGTRVRSTTVARLWLEHEKRLTADVRTFHAGHPLFTTDPDGRPALNTWRPHDRAQCRKDPEAVRLFLEHIRYLFADDGPRFLDWLAHIEQYPGVLPHRAWLHISRSVGTGRSWLQGLVCRLWPGSVAAGVDLGGMLDSGFNGRLSRKILAVVEEIREGLRESPWAHAERLKSIITEDRRMINPKYGRQTEEFNACRWLMFSNYESALPLPKEERRIEVHICDRPPREGAYYSDLYSALTRPEFIGGIARWLADRDLRAFEPGAWALMSESKQRVIETSRTEAETLADLLVAYWPADVLESSAVAAILGGEQGMTAAVRRTAEGAGITPYGRPVKIGGQAVRVSLLRHAARWRRAYPDEVRDALAAGPKFLGSAAGRELVLSLATAEGTP